MTEQVTCKGTTKSGRPCRSRFVNASGFCDAHDVDGTLRMRLRGSRGGNVRAARHKGAGLSRDRLGPLESIPDAQRWLRLIVQAVGARELTHSEGTSMTTGVKTWLMAEDVRLRGEELEQLRTEVARLRGHGVRAS